MPCFALVVDDFETSTTADDFETTIGIKMANTTGHRGRLRELFVAGSHIAAQDIPCAVQICISDNTGDGTGTDESGNYVQLDTASVASNAALIKSAYTAEPTTVGDPIAQYAFNTRGQVHKEWHDPNTAPTFQKNETICIRTAVTIGTTAAELTVSVVWEEF